MKALCRFVLLLLFGSVASVSMAQSSRDGYESDWVDRGGDVGLYLSRAWSAKIEHLAVAIHGICYSACALKLASGENLCVDPLANIGVHEVRVPPPGANFADGISYQGWIRSEELTEVFRKALPPCAAGVFDKLDGFGSGLIMEVRGQDILDACPHIKPCR